MAAIVVLVGILMTINLIYAYTHNKYPFNDKRNAPVVDPEPDKTMTRRRKLK
jgi:hypothetical protein